MGYRGRSARSEKADDPGDRRRRTTKPTAANARRPKGYAPSMVSEHVATLKPSQAPSICHSASKARNAARVTFATGCLAARDGAHGLNISLECRTVDADIGAIRDQVETQIDPFLRLSLAAWLDAGKDSVFFRARGHSLHRG